MSVEFKWETEFKKTEIGEVPRDWEVRKIKDFYNLKYGITASSNEYGNCRLLRQTDLKEGIIDPVSIPYAEIEIDRIEKYLLKEDDLVISRIANVGSIGYVNSRILNSIDKPLVFGSYLLKFEKTREIHNKFTFYFLSSSQMQNYIKSIAEGSTRQNTNAKVVGAFPLCVPSSFEEQSRIATVLSWFDDLIENKKRQNEILEKVAMAIFKSWFVDFEPFKNEEFVYNEELGKEIPKGWEVKSISEIAKIYLGGTPSRNRKEFWNGDIKWATAKDVANTRGVYIFETEEKITKKGLEKSNAKLLPTNTVIITARGTVGEIRLLGEPIAFNQTCYGLVPKDISCYYLFLALRDAITQIKAVSYGTVFDTITMKNFDEIQILLPPQPILEKFHSLVEPLFQKIILNQKQIMVLRKIRDALLPKLVFGKLRVEEI